VERWGEEGIKDAHSGLRGKSLVKERERTKGRRDLLKNKKFREVSGHGQEDNWQNTTLYENFMNRGKGSERRRQ